MEQVENNGVITEMADPQQVQQDVVAQEKPKESRAERDWRGLREQKDALFRQTKMQEELITRLLAQQAQVQASPQAVEEKIEIADDDYVQGSQVKKIVNRAEENARKVAKQEAEKVIHERDQSQFLDKLRRKFDDFEDVVNPETLSILEERDPDLAQSIVELRDPYKIGLQSYKYIKAMGLVESATTTRRVKEVEDKIAKKDDVIQSPLAFEKRPMAQAFKMTKAQKDQLYTEMMGYAAQAGGY